MSAAVFLGVPATTLDLDIVHSRTTDNIERLQKLLASIDSFYRRPKDKSHFRCCSLRRGGLTQHRSAESPTRNSSRGTKRGTKLARLFGASRIAL